MAIEIGTPVHLGSGLIYRVGATKRSNLGRIVATATLTVEVPDDGETDEKVIRARAKQIALQMLEDDPELWRPVTVPHSGPHDPPGSIDINPPQTEV